jgi:N6-L-threonylcarbamoyladenine synthase
MVGRQDADFSLSGLKTALRLEAEKIAPLSEQDVADLCASFQRAVVETVIDRLRRGLRMFRERFGAPSALIASGGVAANGAIRAAMLKLAVEDGVPLLAPPPALCTDNGAMIAWAGAERLAYGLCDTLDTAPRARWPLAQVGKPGKETGNAAGSAGVLPTLQDAGETPATEIPAAPEQKTTEACAAAVAAVGSDHPDVAAPLSPSPLAGEGQGPATTSTGPATGASPQPSPASGGGGAGERAADGPGAISTEPPVAGAARPPEPGAPAQPAAPGATAKPSAAA